MSRIEIRLPKLGESITEATVVEWLKEEGDTIALDEPLLEVATDKVNSEIPSPSVGVLVEKCVSPDDVIEVGALIARIEINQECKQKEVQVNPPPVEAVSTRQDKKTLFSPAVMRLAQSEGLTMDQLSSIKGTGEGGRVSKKDVEKFLSDAPFHQQEELPKESEEHLPMSPMRKAIAEGMVRSFYQAPHASLVAEVDVTDVMELVKERKATFFQEHGVKLTITPFVMQAMAKALKRFPLLNASLQDQTIILKHYINIGIAVNLDKGLVVPVIKNCQESNIVTLATRLQEMATRARERKLTANEMQEGTITLTNFGMTGTLIGVPIIRFPEVAIIGMGHIQKRVVVRDDDSFAVRQMLYVTLTFDHRVIDGIYGCQFLQTFKQNLENVT
jgi:2-oxoglutarate dehydrogenase E2 component (dihydrolipoamide succinyltransferase)